MGEKAGFGRHSPSVAVNDEEESKWSCDYCTFANWPSAVKCTMCAAPRPPTYPRDIYELSAFEKQEWSASNEAISTSCLFGSGSNAPSTAAGSGKWSCTACTYFNWPRALRCVQCRTPKPSFLKNNRRSPGLSPSANSAVISTQQASTSRETLSDDVSPPPDEVQVLGEKFHNLSCGSSTASRKWACRACTYENYPKATKCVICRTPKSDEAESTPSPVLSRSATPTDHPQGATGVLDCAAHLVSARETDGIRM